MDRIDWTLLAQPAAPARTGQRLCVGLARDAEERREAQRLRWRVFALEMGARLSCREPGVDEDIFDRYCDHLVARADERIVGTYRILPPEAAQRIGLYYAETEFDITRLRGIRGRLAEVGRSCIDPGFRTGTVIALLWAGLARYAAMRGYAYLGGCASVPMDDGGGVALAIAARLRETHLAPPEYRVTPRRRVVARHPDPAAQAEMPPLLKGYLRCGAYVCGEPAWDPQFNTADFYVLLPMARVERRYARHFLGRRGEREEQLFLGAAPAAAAGA